MPRRYAYSRFVPNAPNFTLWIVAVIIGILGILGHLTTIETITPNSFILVAIGFMLLVIGTTMRRL